MCVYLYVQIYKCIYTHMEEGVEGNVHSPPRCPCLCASSVHASQLWHVLLLRLTYDTEKIALDTGVNSFLRELEILRS